jgi:site-specific recombinase XerD
MLRRIVRRVAVRAGLELNATPHMFRRSCTTEMLLTGAGMYHVKELLGHESLETLKHYARLTITDLKKTHQRCHPREKDNCTAGPTGIH